MFIVNNWSSFQSYKDRNPPWIRLHKKLIDNMAFQRMSADARALLPMLWLITSEDENPVSGMLRIGYEEIAFRLRIDNKTVKTAIDEIIRAGFLERAEDENLPLFNDKSISYGTVTEVLRNCHPETETETETETDKNKTTSVVLQKKRMSGSRLEFYLEENKLTNTAMPKELAEWVMAEFRWDGPRVIGEWEKFCDYWTAKTGAGATKKDWTATWRNWCRNQAERDARQDAFLQIQNQRRYTK